MKGYTYAQETSRMVGMEAMQNGIVGEGGGAGSAIGDIAGLGVNINVCQRYDHERYRSSHQGYLRFRLFRYNNKPNNG